MSMQLRTILAAILSPLGVVIMIGGIITGKHGAVPIGMIVAAVAAQQWLALRKQARQSNQK
jgi:hypothetical protein